MNNPANFHELRERIRLDGVLTTRTGMHIGGGGGLNAEASDLPVVQDANGLPFIPGASLKGVVRSTIESLLRAVQPSSPLESGALFWTCDPLEQKPARDGGACGFHQTNARDVAVESIAESCAVCRLFGSPVLASHVRFSDALLIGHIPGEPTPVEVRDGVAIDRDLCVAKDKQKYDFEVVAPGAQFAVEIFVENPEPWSMGLLMIGLDQLAEGFSALGGFGSRGLGRVTLRWNNLTRVRAADLLAGRESETLAAATAATEWRAALATSFKSQEPH